MKKQKEEVEDIRKHTLLGRPLATKDFIAKLGKKTRNGVKCITKRQAEETKKQ